MCHHCMVCIEKENGIPSFTLWSVVIRAFPPLYRPSSVHREMACFTEYNPTPCDRNVIHGACRRVSQMENANIALMTETTLHLGKTHLMPAITMPNGRAPASKTRIAPRKAGSTLISRGFYEARGLREDMQLNNATVTRSKDLEEVLGKLWEDVRTMVEHMADKRRFVFAETAA